MTANRFLRKKCCTLTSRPIPENWFYTPSVYNGRTSSLRITGTPIVRPHGVYRTPSTSTSLDTTQNPPKFQPSARFDFELEIGLFLSRPLPPGAILDIAHAHEHIFGLVLLNDWSARDIQMFEMPPLGPFHGKGAGTTVSAWVVTAEALEGSKCASTKVQDPAPLRHLEYRGKEEEATWDVEVSARVVRMYPYLFFLGCLVGSGGVC
jgi:fumarylacetoacetase